MPYIEIHKECWDNMNVKAGAVETEIFEGAEGAEEANSPGSMGSATTAGALGTWFATVLQGKQLKKQEIIKIKALMTNQEKMLKLTLL